MARNKKKYVVDILEDSDEEITTVYELYGATNPFSTNESNAEDYFLPIRSQTGYIRILSKGVDRNGQSYDWKEIIPDNNTHHQVRLMYEHGNSRDIVWIGYMKAEMFTTQAFTGMDELEFPVICPIGLLELSPLTFSCNINTGNTVPTVANIIHMALSSTGVEWQNVYISRVLQPNSGDTINEDLNARISLMNYTDVDPELSQNRSVATWVDTKPMSDLINSIFKFWGWTLFSRGLDIYIIASGAQNYNGAFRKISFEEFTKQTITTTYTYDYTPETLNLAETYNDKALKYRTTNHYEEFILGRRKIKIEAKVNEKQQVIEPKFEKLSYDSSYWDNQFPYIYYDGQGVPKYYSFKFNLQNRNSFIAQLHDLLVNVNPKLNSGYSETNTVLSMDDTWAVDAEKTEFNLRKNVEVLWNNIDQQGFITDYVVDPNTGVGQGPPPTQSLLTMGTIHSLCIPENSMICITASLRAAINPQVQRQFLSNLDYVWMRIQMICDGVSYFWGTDEPTWTTDWQIDPTQGNWVRDNSVYVRVPINNFNKLKTTKQLPLPFYGASGFCVRMMSGQSKAGRLIIHVLDNPSRNNILDNIQVKIVPMDDMMFPTAKDAQTYVGVANETFKEDSDISLDIASGQNNKYGLGQIFRNDCKRLTTLRFYGDSSAMAPEQHLLNRMIAAYNKKRNRLKIVVNEDTYNNSQTSDKAKAVGLPTTTFMKNYNELIPVAYALQAVDHNWRESTMTLTLIERD